MTESPEEKRICDALNAEVDRGFVAAQAMAQHVLAMGTNTVSIPVTVLGQHLVVSVSPLRAEQ